MKSSVLFEEEVHTLVRVAEDEVNNRRCESVPFYQSHADMHLAHKHNSTWKKLEREALRFAQEKYGCSLAIESSWFNVTRADSNFDFHSHRQPTVVFYLKGCTDNGTIYKIESGTWQAPCADNTFSVVEPNVVHATPN